MDKRIATKNEGYVTVEYAIVTAAIIIALLAPIPGIEGPNGIGGVSMVDIVMGSIRDFQSHTTTMLALP